MYFIHDASPILKELDHNVDRLIQIKANYVTLEEFIQDNVLEGKNSRGEKTYSWGGYNYTSKIHLKRDIKDRLSGTSERLDELKFYSTESAKIILDESTKGECVARLTLYPDEINARIVLCFFGKCWKGTRKQYLEKAWDIDTYIRNGLGTKTIDINQVEEVTLLKDS